MLPACLLLKVYLNGCREPRLRLTGINQKCAATSAIRLDL